MFGEDPLCCSFLERHQIKNQSFAGGRRQSAGISMSQNFIKIILQSTIDDNKLELPKLFVRNFGNELSNIVKVVVPNGDFWHIGLSRKEKKVWLEDGLDKLLKHYHSTRAGHVIHFSYQSDSTFHVVIFDNSACETNYPNQGYGSSSGGGTGDEHNKGRRQEDGVSLDILEDDSMIILDSNTADASRGRKSIKKKVGSWRRLHKRPAVNKSSGADATEMLAKHKEKWGTMRKPSIIPSQEELRAKHAEFKPVKPSFLVSLRPEDLQRNARLLPVKFAREHLNGQPKSIKVEGPDGKKWRLKILWMKKAKKKLFVIRGWLKFLKDNKLKESDVCGFELVNEKDAVLNLSIFRAVKYSGPQINLAE